MAWINYGLDKGLKVVWRLVHAAIVLLENVQLTAWAKVPFTVAAEVSGHWLRGTSQAEMRLHASRFAEMLGMGRIHASGQLSNYGNLTTVS